MVDILVKTVIFLFRVVKVVNSVMFGRMGREKGPGAGVSHLSERK